MLLGKSCLITKLAGMRRSIVLRIQIKQRRYCALKLRWIPPSLYSLRYQECIRCEVTMI